MPVFAHIINQRFRAIQIVALLALLCAAQSMKAQDKIVLRSDSVIDCTILAIGKNKVSFYLDNTYMRASDHRRVKIKDVQRIIQSDSPADSSSHWFHNRRSALKLNTFAPLVNTVAFGFESSKVISRSMEYEIGLIGLWNSDDPLRNRGGYLSLGYKFYNDSFLFKILKPHPLKGPYFKPSLVVATYETTRQNVVISTSGTSITQESLLTFAASAMISFGRQFIMFKAIVVDFSTGTGIGYSYSKNLETGNAIDSPQTFHYGFTAAIDKWSPTFDLRMAIGILR